MDQCVGCATARALHSQGVQTTQPRLITNATGHYANSVPALPNRLGDIGTDRARDKKTATVLDGLVIACYQQRMNKPLTDDQLANVRNCAAELAFQEWDETERADLDAALARLDFLERKLKAVDNHLVSALLSFGDGEYNSRTLSDYSIQARANDALEAYNDITE